MIINAATRTRILIHLELDIDPTAATVELDIDGNWYPATWQDTPQSADGRWTQTARTDAYVAGPQAVADGAIVLAPGRHHTRTRVTKGNDVLAAASTTIDVR